MTAELKRHGAMNLVSIDRVWKDAETVSLTTSETTTPVIDKRGFAGGSVQVPAGSSITTLTFYGDHDGSDTFGALYDNLGAAVTLTVAASRVTQLPDALFGVPYIKIVADAEGDVTISWCG